MRESIRRFLCAACGAAVFICTVCDRGQRYCPGACARNARTRSRRDANRRYQQTLRGRRMSAERSRRYRDRGRVTDQGSPPVAVCDVLPASATEAQVETSLRTSSAQSCDSVEGKATDRVAASGRLDRDDAVRCSFCRRWCKPLIRHAPFRRRSSRTRAFEREHRR
jgi:hypothetical protein